MFKVGDKVVYPHHGAGTIEGLQEKVVLNEKHKYYIFKLSLGELKITVPVSNTQDLGLRTVISSSQARKVFNILKDKKCTMPDDWNERFKINNEKIGSGSPFQVAEVVRDLSGRDGLTTREKRMLNKAKQILVSELMHSLDKPEKDVVKKVDTFVN
ncbi:MAG: CarD family transcriptional regulator [Actinobacteria bacterium]|nr:MAG: CarD family transcriptional regulator [Actinomycetota bacterium]